MQKRYWNYREDDKTDFLNRRLIGAVPYGLYRGFDAQLDATLVLKLTHTISGYDEVDVALALKEALSLIITRQGVSIIEDAAIALPVAPNPTFFGRIDLIIVDHEYVTVEGGVEALYSVITGDANVIPVAPTLPNPLRQLIIGRLFCPAQMTNLANSGVVYTKELSPNFNSDDTVVKTITQQHILDQKKIDIQVTGDAGLVVYDGPTETLNFGGKTLNWYKYSALGQVQNNFQEVLNISNLPTVTTGDGFKFGLFTGQRLKFKAGGNIIIGGTTHTNELRIERRDVVYFQEIFPLVPGFGSARFMIWKGGEARRQDYNKMLKMQAFNKGIANLGNIISGGFQVVDFSHNFNGNTYEPVFAVLSSLRSIEATVNNDGAPAAGTLIWMRVSFPLNVGSLRILHNNGNIPVGFKKIVTPTGGPLTVLEGTMLAFMEFEDRWEIVSAIGPKINVWELSLRYTQWQVVGEGGTFPDGSTLIPNFVAGASNILNNQELRLRVDGDRLEIQGVVRTIALGGIVLQTALIVLPVGYRPLNTMSYPTLWYAPFTNTLLPAILSVSSLNGECLLIVPAAPVTPVIGQALIHVFIPLS